MEQTIHKIWNIWDEHAAVMGLRRLPGESNTGLRTRILNIGKYVENSSRQGLVNAISSAMGYDQYNIMTRRIYILTHRPWRDSSFTVTVDGAAQTQIYEDDYITASTGYLVWVDEDGIYTRILEFMDPPSFTRDTTTRRHNGVLVEVTYEYRDGDRVRDYTDRCNPYDTSDESWMGWAPDTEGTVKVRALNDTAWVDDTANGMKMADGTPTERLKAIWREVDSSMPTTWGE